MLQRIFKGLLALRQSALTELSKTLYFMLSVSLLLHALALSLHFAHKSQKPEPGSTPVEIELVNAHSAIAPQNPEAFAQASLDGGGDHANHQAHTALAAQGDEQTGETLQQLQQRLVELQKKQHALLKQKEAGYDVAEQEKSVPQDVTDENLLQLRKNLEAKISHHEEHMATRPKRAQITAAKTMALDFAQYYHQVKNQIENYGTKNFPHESGRPLYGELVLSINIDASGHLGYQKGAHLVNDLVIKESSKNPKLDQMTLSIVRASGPFPPFNTEMRKKYDVIEIIYTFQFTRTGLEAKLQ